MFFARYGYAAAERCLEHLQFRAAESLARLGGRTNRAVILDEQPRR
jgi:hypothetical protein